MFFYFQAPNHRISMPFHPFQWIRCSLQQGDLGQDVAARSGHLRYNLKIIFIMIIIFIAIIYY